MTKIEHPAPSMAEGLWSNLGPGRQTAEAQHALTEAVKALWRIPPPGPNNLSSDPRFAKLREA